MKLLGLKDIVKIGSNEFEVVSIRKDWVYLTSKASNTNHEMELTFADIESLLGV